MRSLFAVKGLFYENAGNKYRSYLDIKRKDSSITIPDIMVVMMNPGSSYPLDGIENNRIVSEAVPDRTQDQIMRVMENVSFDYARILNLSDLRTPKSADLYKFLKSSESKKFPHSIFDPKRKSELEKLFINNVPVIYAWGVNPVLANLSSLAIKVINCASPVGVKKQGTKVAYYHPLPQVHNKQLEWVNQISNMLKV